MINPLSYDPSKPGGPKLDEEQKQRMAEAKSEAQDKAKQDERDDDEEKKSFSIANWEKVSCKIKQRNNQLLACYF